MELNEFIRKVLTNFSRLKRSAKMSVIIILVFTALFFISCGQAVGDSKEICVNKDSGRFEFTEQGGRFAIDACSGGVHTFKMPKDFI